MVSPACTFENDARVFIVLKKTFAGKTCGVARVVSRNKLGEALLASPSA
jgi:hypothetical protein